MSTQITRAPKRRIEKIRNRLNFTVGDSEGSVTLHTAEDSKTLVRAIVYPQIQKIVTPVADMHIVMQHAQAGVRAITPTISQALDVPSANALLLEGSFRQVLTPTIDGALFVWEVDSKAMRKLKETDTIAMSYIADVASSFSITGHVTLFFKE